jgi:hypothetical protein
MEKTYSQKVARAFEIVDYFLLIPAAIGALVGLVAIGSNPLFTLLMYTVLIVGLTLLIGYFKHSRSTLDPQYISALWMTSAVFNFLLLLPSLYYVAMMYQNLTFETLRYSLMGFLIPLSIVFSYITAIILSLKAYSFDKYRKIYGI